MARGWSGVVRRHVSDTDSRSFRTSPRGCWANCPTPRLLAASAGPWKPYGSNEHSWQLLIRKAAPGHRRRCLNSARPRTPSSRRESAARLRLSHRTGLRSAPRRHAKGRRCQGRALSLAVVGELPTVLDGQRRQSVATFVRNPRPASSTTRRCGLCPPHPHADRQMVVSQFAARERMHHFADRRALKSRLRWFHGAQTARPGGARPVRDLLGGRTSPAAVLCVAHGPQCVEGELRPTHANSRSSRRRWWRRGCA